MHLDIIFDSKWNFMKFKTQNLIGLFLDNQNLTRSHIWSKIHLESKIIGKLHTYTWFYAGISIELLDNWTISMTSNSHQFLFFCSLFFRKNKKNTPNFIEMCIQKWHASYFDCYTRFVLFKINQRKKRIRVIASLLNQYSIGCSSLFQRNYFYWCNCCNCLFDCIFANI